MKPLYLVLIILAACCAYVYALEVQAKHIFPKPAIKIDDAIDMSDSRHLSFASKHLCMTPESRICWDTEPIVEVQ